MSKLNIKLRVWVENEDGISIFGDGRAELLGKIEETGSLSKAAKSLSMSYRKAWQHLNIMEGGFDKKLVIRHTGGKKGGGTELTDDGKSLLKRYRDFRLKLDKSRDECFSDFVDL